MCSCAEAVENNRNGGTLTQLAHIPKPGTGAHERTIQQQTEQSITKNVNKLFIDKCVPNACVYLRETVDSGDKMR